MGEESDAPARWPKVELHVHFDGSFDAALLYDAAKAAAAAGRLSASAAAKVGACASVAEFESLVMCTPEDQSLQAMIDRFVFFLPFVQGDLPLLQALAEAFVGRQAAQAVLYTEVRYSPHILTSAARYDDKDSRADADGATGDAAGGGVADGSEVAASAVCPPECDAQARAVVDAVTRGLRAGVAKHPDTYVTQILCFIDGARWSTERHARRPPCAACRCAARQSCPG